VFVVFVCIVCGLFAIDTCNSVGILLNLLVVFGFVRLLLFGCWVFDIDCSLFCLEFVIVLCWL